MAHATPEATDSPQRRRDAEVAQRGSPCFLRASVSRGESVASCQNVSIHGHTPVVPVQGADVARRSWLALPPPERFCAVTVAGFCCERKSAMLPSRPRAPVHWEVQPAVTAPAG